MPKLPPNKDKSRKTVNPGSPDAAAQRQVRMLYGKAAATSSRNATTEKRLAGTSSTTRPVRGGGSKAGDLKKFDDAVNRGKAASSSKGTKNTRIGKDDAKSTRPTRGGGSMVGDIKKAFAPKTGRQATRGLTDAQKLKKLGDRLAATDVKGKGRSAASGRRQAALKGYAGQSGRKAANSGRPKSLPKTM